MNIKTTVEVTEQTPVQDLYVAETITTPDGYITTYTGQIQTDWASMMLKDNDIDPDTTELGQYYKAVELDNPEGSKINVFVGTDPLSTVVLALQYLSDPDGTLSDEASKLWSDTYHNNGYLDGTYVVLGRTMADDERAGQVIADLLGDSADKFDGMALNEVIFRKTKGRGVLTQKANLADWYSNSTEVQYLAEELRDTYLS